MARQPNRELTPDDLTPGSRPTIDLSPEAMLNRPPEEIVMVDKPLSTEFADEIKFMEERVLIRLERNSDKYQPVSKDFSVNGRTEWVPIGQPYQVRRKTLEVILRSQPINIETTHEGTDKERPRNLIQRNQSTKYPVSILSDPSPRGAEWAQRVALEA